MDRRQFITGYSDLSLHITGPLSIVRPVNTPLMVVHFRLNNDVSSLFPYVNAVSERAFLYEKPFYIRFKLDGFACALHPDEGAAGVFENRPQAQEFLERLIVFLNEIHHRKDTIRPNHKKHRRMSVLDILKLLPKDNCRECGYPTCMAFAAALSRQEVVPRQCPKLGQPLRENVTYPVYDEQGNLETTIMFDIDTTVISHDLRKKQEYIGRLENEMSKLMRIDRAVAEYANQSLAMPLTERELQVLRLVARGATNSEVSDLLRISPHTVKSHVIHIFNKLGVDDRTEAAVWAARHDLV